MVNPIVATLAGLALVTAEPDEGSESTTCALGELANPTSITDLGCAAGRLGTLLLWVVAVGLLVYIFAGFALRFIPLPANTGMRGTLRRSREQLPVVGRAYRPRVQIEVTQADGKDDTLSRTIQELLVDEMSAAGDSRWFSERLVGDVLMTPLVSALDETRPGFGAIGKFLAERLPQERFRLRVQLHATRADQAALTAELIDRGNRSLASHVFRIRPPADHGDANLVGHELLVPAAAAWFTFELFQRWPGEQLETPNPMNTRSSDSYGEFRTGVVYESLGRKQEARAAYHRALDVDDGNVGALLNLALLNSRDPSRIDRCITQLGQARTFVDRITNDLERADLRIRIEYVRAIARLNQLIWRADEDPTSMERWRLLADATGAVQEVARVIDARPALPAVHLPWREADQRLVDEVVQAYRRRVAALAAGLAVEHEHLTGTRPSRRAPVWDFDHAITLLSQGRRLDFPTWERLLLDAGSPLNTQVAYSLACAYSRRRSVEEAVDLLRDALAGAPDMADWALGADGDPALREVRAADGALIVLNEFVRVQTASEAEPAKT